MYLSQDSIHFLTFKYQHSNKGPINSYLVSISPRKIWGSPFPQCTISWVIVLLGNHTVTIPILLPFVVLAPTLLLLVTCCPIASVNLESYHPHCHSEPQSCNSITPYSWPKRTRQLHCWNPLNQQILPQVNKQNVLQDFLRNIVKCGFFSFI